MSGIQKRHTVCHLVAASVSRYCNTSHRTVLHHGKRPWEQLSHCWRWVAALARHNLVNRSSILVLQGGKTLLFSFIIEHSILIKAPWLVCLGFGDINAFFCFFYFPFFPLWNTVGAQPLYALSSSGELRVRCNIFMWFNYEIKTTVISYITGKMRN